MPTAIELATVQLRLHCNQDLERIPLNKVLDGLWSVLVWASGFSSEMNFEHISAKQKGMHIGTGAIFTVADCLLHCQLKQRVLACLEISVDFLLSWLFLDGKNFGRNQRVLCEPLPGCLLLTAWRSLRAGLGPSKATRLANYFAQITILFSGPRVSHTKVWRKDGRRLTNLSTCSFSLFGLR